VGQALAQSTVDETKSAFCRASGRIIVPDIWPRRGQRVLFFPTVAGAALRPRLFTSGHSVATAVRGTDSVNGCPDHPDEATCTLMLPGSKREQANSSLDACRELFSVQRTSGNAPGSTFSGPGNQLLGLRNQINASCRPIRRCASIANVGGCFCPLSGSSRNGC
jgi:hypothetical protein